MRIAIPMLASTMLAALATFPSRAGEHIQLVKRALTDSAVDPVAHGDSVGDLLTLADAVCLTCLRRGLERLSLFERPSKSGRAD